jgi:hypothetical protein
MPVVEFLHDSSAWSRARRATAFTSAPRLGNDLTYRLSSDASQIPSGLLHSKIVN